MTKSDSKTTEDGMVEIGEISSAWGIVPQEVKTVKDNVWRIKAVDGEYALKRSGLSPAKLQFIAEAQNHLTHCGFQYFSHPLFCGGAPFLEREDGIYTLYENKHTCTGEIMQA